MGSIVAWSEVISHRLKVVSLGGAGNNLYLAESCWIWLGTYSCCTHVSSHHHAVWVFLRWWSREHVFEALYIYIYIFGFGRILRPV